MISKFVKLAPISSNKQTKPSLVGDTNALRANFNCHDAAAVLPATN